MKYELRYLPLFYQDLDAKLVYVCDILKNPLAANSLLELVESNILNRQNNPEAFEKYTSLKERKYPYYRIYIKNFVVYYVVIRENNKCVMEVRRFLYKREKKI